MNPMTVAVKFGHPGVSAVIQRDFVIINWVAKVYSRLPALRWLRLNESVQQFDVFMLSQVDLAREATQLSRFLYNFCRWKDVSFPKPLYPLVQLVLVETYEQGESVARYVDQLEGNNHIVKSLAHIGTHTHLNMLLVCQMKDQREDVGGTGLGALVSDNEEKVLVVLSRSPLNYFVLEVLGYREMSVLDIHGSMYIPVGAWYALVPASPYKNACVSIRWRSRIKMVTKKAIPTIGGLFRFRTIILQRGKVQ